MLYPLVTDVPRSRRPIQVALSSLLASISVACAATTPSATSSAVSVTKASSTAAASSEPPLSPWQSCYASFQPTGSVKQDLDRLTRSCGTVGGMHPLTRMLEAKQSEADPADRYAFYIPKAGGCYRIYAVAESSVKDLDVLLRSPNGDDLVGDLTEDAWPVVPPNNPVCVDKPGMYLIEVSVYRGAGKYAVQVWGT